MRTRRRFRIPILGMQVELFAPDQGYLVFQPELRGKVIRGEHSPTINGKRSLDLGVLSTKEMEREYALTGDGLVLSRKVITNAGVAFLVQYWKDASKAFTNMNAHGNGTGTVAEASTDTALGTEVETRVAGTKTNVTANILVTVATITMAAGHNITEHGIFDSTTTSGSTLWDRSVFGVLTVNSTDSVQYTYSCTVQSNG